MLEQALNEWRSAVGAANVLDDAKSRSAAETATFATQAQVPAIVRPADTEQVRECLAIARSHGLHVYPISAGKNWGLGSRVPPRSGSVLLDLGRMRRIVDFDEQMAHVTVEPGVTFGQLYDFLRERGSRLFANTTGASPHASVVGNALERGDGTGPYGDRIRHVCALEAVLSTGEVVHTGYDRFGDNPLTPIHAAAPGPALDGLFAQSNLAVITRMTLWLSPLPRSLSAVRFSIQDPGRLAEMVDAVRELRLDGTLRSVAGIWNDYRVISTHGQYPWGAAGGRTPLARSVVREMSHAWGGATWFGLTAIYAASPEQGQAHRSHVQRVLGAAVDDLDIVARDGEPKSGHELLNEAEPAFMFLQGIPHEGSLRSVYWRKRDPVPEQMDPDLDRCGVVWLCPLLPLRGSDVARAVKSCEKLMPEHGFEPLIAMIAQTERSMYLVPLIIYDRDHDSDDRAMQCHDAMLEELSGMGYLPYRLGIQSMAAMPAPRDDFGRVVMRLKHAFDPGDVIAPGRYDFRGDWPDDDD